MPCDAQDASTLIELLSQSGCQVDAEEMTTQSHVRITSTLLDRWFDAQGQGRLTYRQHLAQFLDEEELHLLETIFRRQLLGKTVLWQVRRVLLTATKP